MSPLRDLIQEAIGSHGRNDAVAILGCGSELRGDDAVGPLVASSLADLAGRAQAFNGDVAPENQTGAIKQFNPGLVLLVDALDMGLEPGEARLIDPDEVEGVSFSTHMLPLPIIMDYLRREIGCPVLLIGIQAKSLEFLGAMTPEVARAGEALVAELRQLLA